MSRKFHSAWHWQHRCLTVCFLLAVQASQTQGQTRTWIGGNGSWNGANSNWSPADEPDPGETALFNTSNTVTMSIDNQVGALTVTGGADLSTAQRVLQISGLLSVSGAGSTFTVHTNNFLAPAPPPVSVAAGDIVLSSGARMLMANDVAVNDQSGIGGMTINTGTELYGNSRLLFNDSFSGVTNLLNNNGAITAGSFGNTFVTAQTLQIVTTDTEARIDLDGGGENGAVNVLRSQTLDIDATLRDNFDGTILLKQSSTFDMFGSWTLAAGTITVDNGEEPPIPPFVPGVAAGVGVIEGGTLTMSSASSRIEVVDSDGALQFDAPLVANDGVIDTFGTITFNAPATIGSGVDFVTHFDTDFVFNDTVTVNDSNWNWDNNGGSNNDITINSGGRLNANITAAGASTLTGELHIAGGVLNVQGDGNDWHQNAGLVAFEGTALGRIEGDKFVQAGGTFRSDSGANGDVTASTLWDAGQLVVNGELELIGAVEWAGTTVSGSGILEQEGNATVTANTTIGVDTYDWDQSSTTVNQNVFFVVNVGNIDRGNDTFNSNTINVNGGTLSVNVDDGSWTLGSGGVVNLTGFGSISNSSQMVVASGGVVNAHGTNGSIDTALTIQTGGVVNIQDNTGRFTSGGVMTLAGGNVEQVSGNATYVHQGLAVTGNSTIAVSQFDFDNAATTIEASGDLLVDVDSFAGGSTTHANSITINAGNLEVQTGTNQWTVRGSLNLNGAISDAAVVSGDDTQLGNLVTATDARLNVGGNGQSRINASMIVRDNARIEISPGATLRTSTLSFNSDSSDAILTGGGTWIMAGNTTFDAGVTIDMQGGLIDLDNSSDISAMTANDTVVLSPVTINVGTLADYGVAKGVGGSSVSELTIDKSSGNSGLLTVNLDDPEDEWTLHPDGVLRLIGTVGGTIAGTTVLIGSDINLNGVTHVDRDVSTLARVDIGGTVALHIDGFTRGEFMLRGGTVEDPNRLEGGHITADGLNYLVLNSGISLAGHGTIDSRVRLGSQSRLFADGGTLSVNRTMELIGGPAFIIGANEVGSQLFIPITWHTNLAEFVLLAGGEIRGATIINDGTNGILGHGSVFAPIDNQTKIEADDGLLVLENTFNDIEWDGFGDTGVLIADTGSLELRDNETYLYHTTVTVNAGQQLFTNGFSLEYATGSTVELTDGRLRSTHETTLHGDLIVDGAGSSLLIQPAGFVFASTSSTSWNATTTLSVEGDARIQPSATFTGPGLLQVAEGSELVLESGANVGVAIENQGTLHLGDAVAQAVGLDFSQTDTGMLPIQIEGELASQFDRLTLTGVASLAGLLTVELVGGFEPQADDLFTIVAAAARQDMFDGVDFSAAGLGADLEWEVIYNPTNVQLLVVSTSLPGDFNNDGFVDAIDYAVWREGLGTIFTSLDYDIWRANFGSSLPATGATQQSGVPEPGSMVMVLVSLTLAAVCRPSKLARPERSCASASSSAPARQWIPDDLPLEKIGLSGC